MSKNVGTVDKVIRVVVGLVLLSLLFRIEGNGRWVGLIGIVPLLTAAFGCCPLYRPFGFSTCSAQRPPAEK